MIITIIVVGTLIIGITCLTIYNRAYNCPDCLFGIGLILTVLSCLFSLFIGIEIIYAQVNEDVHYQNKLHEREILEYRIDNMGDNIVGNEMLYNDIVEFNNSLRSVKKWANNPFTSWFCPEDVATIDYIDINSD